MAGIWDLASLLTASATITLRLALPATYSRLAIITLRGSPNLINRLSRSQMPVPYQGHCGGQPCKNRKRRRVQVDVRSPHFGREGCGRGLVAVMEIVVSS